tara:strand:+ start:741 stop:1496 length:756 start_codon:yes stop_codon:yes gene_type:complete
MILTSDAGGVRTLTLNRPDKLNAFNDAQFDALAEAVLDAGTDDSVKVVVLTGAGRAFSAGADLSGGRHGDIIRHGFPGCVDVLVDFEKPLLIAVNGLGVGIGATIVGLADAAFMAESSRLRCPFSALGLTAEACSTYTFPMLMGRHKASWFLLSAEWLSAQQCADAGLVADVLPDEGFLEAVQEKAATLARLPMSSLRQTKSLIMAPHREAMRTAARAENEGLASLRGGTANVEAVTAFAEKREPDFSGIN